MIALDKIRITEELLMDICQLEVFNSRLPYIHKNSYWTNLLKAQARTIGTASSLRIEGIAIKDYEAERLLGGMMSTLHKEKDAAEARGYAEALDYINDYFEIMEINELNLKKLHKMIVQNGDGEYRKGVKPHQNIQVDEPYVSNAEDHEIPSLTIELLDETDMLLKSKSHHPILVIALFIVHFLAINPFEEGNGRVSRLLLIMLLQKAGYSFIRYQSVEAVIEESRKTYLYALKRTQQTFSGSIDYASWLGFFTKTLLKTCLRLEVRMSKLEKTKANKDELSPLELDAISTIRQNGKIYTSALVKQLPQYKMPTIKKALSELVAKDIIVMLGKGRGTYYKVKE